MKMSRILFSNSFHLYFVETSEFSAEERLDLTEVSDLRCEIHSRSEALSSDIVISLS